jgi:RHS repeat-associated protein
MLRLAGLIGSARLWLDDKIVIDGWADNAGGDFLATYDNGCQIPPTGPCGSTPHRFRVEFRPGTSGAHLELRRTRPDGVEGVLPGTQLAPRYGLVTKTTVDDSPASAPAKVTNTAYAHPSDSQATSVTVVPALITATAYEPDGLSHFNRRTSRTLPAGNTWNYVYYGADTNPATATNPCPAGGSADQGGALRQRVGPDPDGPGPQTARVDESVYDAAGRVVASRVGTDPWTCAAYDGRGRIVTKSFPAFGTEAARTVTYNYAVGATPLVTSVSDTAGTITTTVDLLGRTVSYQDVWGNTTTSTYDQAGRVTDTAGPAGAQHWDYDAVSRPVTQQLDGLIVATATYGTMLTKATFPSGTGKGGNGTSSNTILRDSAGRITGLTWNQSGTLGTVTTDTVTYSQSGRVIDEVIDAVDARVSADNFAYDAAGRLIDAYVPGHHLAYSFAASGGCGYQTTTGLNTNRTSVSDNNSTIATYCYDAGDKLTSATGAASPGALVYDSHGNTSTLGAQALTYDGADRHLSTTTGATTVRYVRDAIERIVARTENGVTTRYGFTGTGDSAVLVQSGTGALLQRTIALPGGAMVTKQTAGDVWSYPNIHGDVTGTANAAGVKQGQTTKYDPFGQAVSGAVPDNSSGNYDYGWLGQHQRGIEHASGISTIEMGARQYLPLTGRFLQVDPVEGGSANNYDYVYQDPANQFDLAGTFCILGTIHYKDSEGHKQKKCRGGSLAHPFSVGWSAAGLFLVRPLAYAGLVALGLSGAPLAAALIAVTLIWLLGGKVLSSHIDPRSNRWDW